MLEEIMEKVLPFQNGHAINVIKLMKAVSSVKRAQMAGASMTLIFYRVGF
ncbi:hypothetical protein T296_22880 [Pantoea agglomerans Eh318]|nr:hypothetical protein T296_22880 [Pantoea agglomerans Eh318]